MKGRNIEHYLYGEQISDLPQGSFMEAHKYVGLSTSSLRSL